MAKLFKIVLIAVLILLVVFAAAADQLLLPDWLQGLNLVVYLRLAALLGLIVAVFMSWGFKRKIEASQKYQRAQQVVSQAETAVERKKASLDLVQKRLEMEFVRKELLLKEELEKDKAEYHQQLRALKEQNMKLKDTVGKLMQAVKKK